MSSRVQDIEFHLVIRYLERAIPHFADDVLEEFLAYVEPELDGLSREGMDRLSELALEWAIFDRRLEDGLTGIETYCRANPCKRGNRALTKLLEALDNEFSAMFSVERIDIDAHRLEIEDVITGGVFSVRDVALSEGLYHEGGHGPYGVLLARLTRVDGKWLFPGNPIAFYPVVMSDRMKKALGEGAGEHPSFLDLVRQAFGSAGDMVGGSLDSRLPDVDFDDPEQLAAVRIDLEDRYRSLAARFEIDVPWEDVVSAIASEGGEISPADLMQQMLGDLEGARIETMDDFAEIVDAWVLAWNVFPHDALGGRAPVERAAE